MLSRLLFIALCLILAARHGNAQPAAQPPQTVDLEQLLFMVARQEEDQIKALQMRLEQREKDWRDYVAPFLVPPPQVGQK